MKRILVYNSSSRERDAIAEIHVFPDQSVPVSISNAGSMPEGLESGYMVIFRDLYAVNQKAGSFFILYVDDAWKISAWAASESAGDLILVQAEKFEILRQKIYKVG